jgi:glycosyltransferase involved in cell wall biosynthesis
MYILIVARNFPKESEPLQGIFEFDQAKALQSYGHKVVYLSLDLRSIRRKRRLGKYWTEADGLPILNLSIPLGNIPSLLRRNIGRLGIRLYYKEILEKHGKPDIIHAHFSGIGYMSKVLKKKLNVPLILTEHSSKITEQKPSFWQRKFGVQAYSVADCVIAVSSLLANNLKEHWNVEADVVGNIVDTTSFYFEDKMPTENFSFISVGHLIPGKGFDLLIEAFKKANFNKNVSLQIIGRGSEERKLRNLILQAGLIKQIKLLGFLNRIEIAKIMRGGDAFVLASRGETFGVVYIEAMLVGLPVIATACGGPEDFVTPENGLIVPIDNVIALKEALIETRVAINKYNRKGISESSRRNFSPEYIASQLTNIYLKVLNNRNSYIF